MLTGARGQAPDSIVAAPPPRTPEQIERHERLKKLTEQTFFGVNAVFSANGSTYVLKSLKFTPRYSVIYEIPPGAVVPVVLDGTPGEPASRTREQRATWERYRAVVDSPAKKEGKPIRGDIP